MKIEEIKNECTACGACLSICPTKCIQFSMDNEGFWYPVVDSSKCIHCNKCEKICHCLHKTVVRTERYSYYGFSRDENIRKQSSSGGAFYALASQILNSGGNVYGAAFDYEELILKAQSTDEVGLAPLMKSKYIESYMGDTISKIQADLMQGRKVLFCGTPCEAAGIKKVIGDNQNFLLCDFICHGVPSSGIFKEYLQAGLGKNEKLLALDFRPKASGWSSKNIKLVKTTTTTTTTTPYELDFFYKGFMRENAFLRRSCYECQYRTNHAADISIADFWGYRQLDPSLNDEKGLSMLIAHTTKGKEAIESLQNFELFTMDNRYSDYAFVYRDYSKYLPTRQRFYEEQARVGFKKAAKKVYMKGHWKNVLKYRIKKLLGKL